MKVKLKDKIILALSLGFLVFSFKSFSSSCSKALNEINLTKFSYENQDILTFLCEQVEEQEGQVKKEGRYSYLVLFNNLYSKSEAQPKAGESKQQTKKRLIELSRTKGQAFLRELRGWIQANGLEKELVLENNLNNSVFLGFHIQASFRGISELIKAHENNKIANHFKPLALWKDAI